MGKGPNQQPAQIKTPPVYRIVITQLIVTLLVSAVFYLVRDLTAAISALVGGMIYLVPNAYFIRKAFAYTGARHAQQVLVGFYKGEVGKLVLTAVLFALVFKTAKSLDVAALFTGFIAVLISNCFASLLLK